MDDLSIVIPVGPREEAWPSLLELLLKFSSDVEIILVGPHFKEERHDQRVHFIYCPEGRARQLNTGAIFASKKNIWFLHADSKPESSALLIIEKNLKQKPDALFYFDLNFLSDGPRLVFLNAIGSYWRSHTLSMPFGDQGFFMQRRTFFSLGLFDETARYGEDHLLVWRARQRGVEVIPCNAQLFTSARKYREHGWLLTTANHLQLTYKQALPEWIKLLRQQKNKKHTAAIAIVTKTPGASEIKSRLASSIGKEKAEEFFYLSLKATQRTVIEAIRKSNGHLEAYWAIAEKDEINNSLWNSFKTIVQGSGDLGQRLHRIYSELQKKHRKVFLIGADMPHLDYRCLLKANFHLSTKNEFVIGETDDGGFYLFGGRKSIGQSIWNSIAYSSDHTASELIEKLGKNHFIFLERNFDIDYLEDLQKLAAYPREGLLPEQLEVINWIRPELWEQT